MGHQPIGPLATSGLCQLSSRGAELVKSFEQHREFPKVLTTSATIFSCNLPLVHPKTIDEQLHEAAVDDFVIWQPQILGRSVRNDGS